MKLATPKKRAPRDEYVRCVDYLLQRRHATTIAERRAKELVNAAWRAGYSPRECVELLAEIDGLPHVPR